jgi:PadR family transcriptional regulator PadR
MEPLARLGRATVDVLTVLLDSDDPRWGLELIKLTGRPSGTVYPLLDRLERAGWVTSDWDADVLRPGPRRRMYQLTPDGTVAARDALRRVARQAVRGRSGWAAQPDPGMSG